MNTKTIVIIAALFTSFPLIQLLQFQVGNGVMVDGISISALIVIPLAIGFSLMSWFLLSLASKNVPPMGIFLGISTGALLLVPLSQTFGPMAAIIIGIVAGVVAFLFQQKLTHSTKNKSLIAGIAIILVSYLVLFTMIYLAQTNTDDGIGEWSGTAEGMEPQGVYFGNIEPLVNYILLLIVLPSLVIAWIKSKENGSIVKYYFYFGITLIVIGGLFSVSAFQSISDFLFFINLSNTDFLQNPLEVVLYLFLQQISFHVLAVTLIIIGILVIKKRFVEIENEN